jgi:hypothetical protein
VIAEEFEAVGDPVVDIVGLLVADAEPDTVLVGILEML